MDTISIAGGSRRRCALRDDFRGSKTWGSYPDPCEGRADDVKSLPPVEGPPKPKKEG
jgi:hypothetical protein